MHRSCSSDKDRALSHQQELQVLQACTAACTGKWSALSMCLCWRCKCSDKFSPSLPQFKQLLTVASSVAGEIESHKINQLCRDHSSRAARP